MTPPYNRFSNRLVVAAIVFLCWSTGLSAADRTTIAPVEKWSNVFSGANATFHYVVETTEALDGRFQWSLSVKGRTVEHGQSRLALAAGRAAEIAFAVKTPEVKPGVILKGQLSAAAYSAGNEKPAAEHSKTVWIFPRDPFVDRADWLKGLKITLFDPDGKTADVLDKARVPYSITKNISALDEVGEGMLLIGEGTAWRDHTGLGETIVKAAARGRPVLCLAPGEGSLVLPGSEGAEMPRPDCLTLRRDNIIEALDKRLDADAWPPDGKVAATRLAIKSDRDQVVVEATNAGQGWSWLESRYAASQGRLIVCSFSIVYHWEATPTPRYLLAALLERLSDASQSSILPQAERK